MSRNTLLLKIVITLFMVISLFLPIYAFGEEIIINDEVAANESIDSEFLLMHEDEVHILRCSFTKEMRTTHYPDYSIDEPFYTYYYQCYSLQEDHTFVSCENHCESIFENGITAISCSPDGNTYLIDGQYQLFQWTPDQASPWKAITVLDTSGQGLYSERYSVENRFFVQDNHVYLWFANETDTSAALFDYDCTAMTRRKVCSMAWIMDVKPGVQGRIYLSGSKTGGYGDHYQVDIKTGEMEKVPLSLPEYWTGVVAKNGGWYIYGATSVFDGSPDGPTEKLFAHSGETSWQMAVDSRGENLYALQLDHRLAIYPVVKQTDVHQLRVAGDLSLLQETSGYIPALADFSKSYGEVELVQASQPQTFQEITQALVLEDDSFDLMLLNVHQADMEALFSKGYYVNLSDVDGVDAFMDKVYPVYQEYCVWGEEIAALPIFTYNRAMLWNRELWDSCGIPTVPDTWDTFFDCIEWLDAEGYLDAYPLFSDTGSRYPDAYTRILLYLLNSHCAASAKGGETFTWKDADLQRLLERLQALEPVIRRNDSYTFKEDGFLYPEASLSALESTGGKHISLPVYGEAYSPMLLAMKTDEEPNLTATLTVLVVNPNGKNAELATQLCAYIAQYPTPYQRCIFLQEGAEGIRTEDFSAWEAEWQKEMDEVKAAVNALESGNTAGLAALQEKELTLLAQWQEKDRTSWLVTPPSAEKYQTCVPALWIRTKDSADIIDNYGDKVLRDFVEGSISAKEMLNSLDKLLFTMQMEKQ